MSWTGIERGVGICMVYGIPKNELDLEKEQVLLLAQIL